MGTIILNICLIIVRSTLIMIRSLLLLACLAAVAMSLQCYSCDTWNDTVTSCGTTICNGQNSVCYKREYVFEDDEDEREYEERGCVTDKDSLDGSCEENDGADEYDKCKIYTCNREDRCNDATPLTITGLLVTIAAAMYF